MTAVGAGEVVRLVGLTPEVGVCAGSVEGVSAGTGATPRTLGGAMAVTLDAGVGSTDSHPEPGPAKTSGQV